MARKYKNVRGTNDFLIAAIGLTLLGLWAVRDGWFPTKKLLEKHPLVEKAVFEDAGRVDAVLVETGMNVSSNSPLIRMNVKDLDQKQADAEERLKQAEIEIRRLDSLSATSTGDTDYRELAEQKEEEIKEIKREIAGIKQTRMRHILRSKHKGKIKEISVEPDQRVDAGDIAAVIRVHDHFYTFNKSLAIGSLLGAAICAIIHIKLK